jgi:drug/metabolite transporter (DMT)-like permease
VAIWSNLQPVLTAALAWAIYGEPITPTFVAGGVMVLAGVVLTERG